MCAYIEIALRYKIPILATTESTNIILDYAAMLYYAGGCVANNDNVE